MTQRDSRVTPPVERLRATVAGREPLRFEVERDEAAEAGAASVRAMDSTGEERATGARRFEVIVDGWRFEVTVESARLAGLRERAARAARAASEHAPVTRVVLRAQIPGRVVGVAVVAGEHVETGQRLLSVEAMKMENEVRAPRAGTIERVAVTAGQRLELGDELVVIS